jgi:hypothetical protein
MELRGSLLVVLVLSFNNNAGRERGGPGWSWLAETPFPPTILFVYSLLHHDIFSIHIFYYQCLFYLAMLGHEQWGSGMLLPHVSTNLKSKWSSRCEEYWSNPWHFLSPSKTALVSLFSSHLFLPLFTFCVEETASCRRDRLSKSISSKPKLDHPNLAKAARQHSWGYALYMLLCGAKRHSARSDFISSQHRSYAYRSYIFLALISHRIRSQSNSY